MLRCAVWLLGAMRKVVEAGLVRGRSTEVKGPGSKVRFELLWERRRASLERAWAAKAWK